VKAENEDISFIPDYDPSIPELHADESMLIQVVLNITRNAVKAITSSSQTKGKVRFRTRTKRNSKVGAHTYSLVAKIDIEDNGGGIPEELQEKIFMPMITGHAEGTGLGLPIAQSIIKQHDGLIEFTSKPDKTVFTILIPVITYNGVTE